MFIVVEQTLLCAGAQDLLHITLWMGAMGTTTNMHYDANNNLLFVLRGSKWVALLAAEHGRLS